MKSGFVAIVGRPNAGKSTLLNQIVGQKVAIVTDKPQTTRNQIRGILTTPAGQLVFIDTPGMHKPQHRLGEYMLETALRAIQEVDLVLHLVDGAAPFGAGDQHLVDRLAAVTTPVVLGLNKTDLLAVDELARTTAVFAGKRSYAAVVPLAAAQGKNLDRLVECLFEFMPEGPQYYPTEMVTDQPEKFVVGELIRERVITLTREEIPHSIAVVIDELTLRTEELLYIRALIYVERDSQKGILIGRSGGMLKQIGQEARAGIEQLLGNKVYLDLWVKVKKDWREDGKQLRNLGYSL